MLPLVIVLFVGTAIAISMLFATAYTVYVVDRQ